jgi:phospholipase/lecithinase/hemolysin
VIEREDIMARALILVLAFLLSPIAQAGYSALQVFGDSLSDSGNAYVLSGGVWPPSPPYAQRFSDGPTAAEYLAGHLGIDLAPSVAGGTNHAVGGATTGLLNYNFEVQSPFPLPPALEFTGMQAQLAAFLGTAPSFDPARTLFLVWGGPNDIFLASDLGIDPLTAIDTAVSNLIGMIGALAAVGATDFLVPNMASMAQTPLALTLPPDDRATLDLLSTAFNGALAEALGRARSGLIPGIPGGLNLMGFDTASLFDAVIADPGRFGLTDATTPCLLAQAASCEDFLFFDALHITTAAHALLGAGFFARLPEPATPALMAVALLAAALVASRRRAAST